MEEDQVTSAPIEPIGQPEAEVVVPTETTVTDPISDTEQESSAPEIGQPDAKSEEAARREAGALAKAQRELVERDARLQSLETQASKFAELIARDPNTYRDALMETQGLTKEQADAQVAALKAQGHWTTNPVQQAPTNVVPQVDPYTAARVVLEQEKATESLMEAYPELKNQSPENIANYQQAFYLAQAARSVRPSMSLKDALIQQYGFVTGKTSTQIQEAKEAGRIEGMAQLNAATQAASTGAVAQTTKSPNYNLSEADRAIAKLHNMSDADYYKRKSEKVTMVD
jgi:hypothetical protein